ncbi:putative solute-binding protein [Isoalcanivorax beigongshangi]|uniref:Solute-binding protein n=1 Tax=Isoalcanivorax beigongshangi TaxID=3238810 RepID=A0ABV4AH63_9GAMM
MRYNKTVLAVASSLLLAVSGSAVANEKRTMCVFDIIGTSGDIYNIMKDYRTAALDHGYDLTLKAYTDENIAAEDLKAGQCDAAAITGLRGRQFNNYTGSLDSIGAVPSYDAMRAIIQVIGSNNERIVPHLKSGNFQVMGVAPMGAAYLFVKDKSINNVNALAGKSISVMEYDEAQAKMAASVGMSPVMSDITNFSGRFNNGSVDISFAPVMAYSALELYKGMEPNGGIVQYVLGQLTTQVIGRQDKFNDDFAAWSRQYFSSTVFDRAMRVINNSYSEIDKKWWIPVSEGDAERYDEMMRDARIELTRAGVYNKDMMSLLRNIRCRMDASRAECSDQRE